MFGAANIWWVPLSNVFGRRPVILFSLVILTASSVWAAEAKSFNSLLAARVFQGIGGATADTLCPGVIGEIFFRHERGRAMVGASPVLEPELELRLRFMLRAKMFLRQSIPFFLLWALLWEALLVVTLPQHTAGAGHSG